MPVLKTKTKLSKSAYILIAIAVIAIIALPLLHVVGVIDLSFIGNGFMAVMMWAAADGMNGVLFVSGIFISGALFYYAIKKYVIGTKVPMGAGAYHPVGQTITPATPTEEETVVS